jgi:hypothetical protein
MHCMHYFCFSILRNRLFENKFNVCEKKVHICKRAEQMCVFADVITVL